MNIIKLPKYPCSFCKKNEATQLCDFVVGYAWTSMKDEKGRMIGRYHETCNNQICKSCATNHAGYDLCPSCNELYKLIQKKHDRRIGNFLIDLVSGRVSQ